MNRKKTLITWAIVLAVEVVIVLVVAGFELGSRGGGMAPVMQYLSDGFFAAALGCTGVELPRRSLPFHPTIHLDS